MKEYKENTKERENEKITYDFSVLHGIYGYAAYVLCRKRPDRYLRI